MPGHTRPAAQQVSVRQYGAADAHAERQHHDVIESTGRTPYHLTGQCDARIVVREDGYIRG